MAAMLETIERTTKPRPAWTILWLHGLGADGHDFAPIVPELVRPDWPGIRFVFPHAPVRPVTINNGMRMRAWYDIFPLGSGREDDAGIRASQKLVEELIKAERGKKIVLAGFSQGGAIVLQAALRHPDALAGVMALSTYLPLAATLAAERHAANHKVPIFMAHGRFDDIIPIDRARKSREVLERLGYAVTWKEYPMPHSVCAEEIADISRFLATIL
jgi:phospholipase/carboxylesterase